MSPRVRTPQTHPIVTRLKKRASVDTADVVALLGFVGEGRPGHIRIYPDVAYQRWMDLPENDVVDSAPLGAAAGGELEDRTVVWVKRDAMFKPLFAAGVLEMLDAQYTDGWISTWALIPDTRYLAAEMLDLIAPWAGGDSAEGGYA